MRTQQRSKTIKKGETTGHALAVEKVYFFLEQNRIDNTYLVDIDVPLIYDDEFAKQLPVSHTFPGHKADIGIYRIMFDEYSKPKEFKLLAIIEINGNVGFHYPSEVTGRAKLEPPTKHSKPNQIRNDKIVKNWCKNKGIKYIVLLKEEVLGDCKTQEEVEKYELTSLGYMETKLKRFLKC